MTDKNITAAQKASLAIAAPLYAAKEISRRSCIEYCGLQDHPDRKAIVVNALRRERNKSKLVREHRLLKARTKYYNDDSAESIEVESIPEENDSNPVYHNSVPAQNVESFQHVWSQGVENLFKQTAIVQQKQTLSLLKDYKHVELLQAKLIKHIKGLGSSADTADIRSALSTLEQLLELKRKIAMLPWGKLELESLRSKDSANAAPSINLDLSGLSDYIPKKIS